MATHRISYWELTATNKISNSEIKFGVPGAISSIDKSQITSFEDFIAYSLKNDPQSSAYYEEGKYCVRVKKSSIELKDASQWNYGQHGKKKLKDHTYMTIRIDAGADNRFNYSYDKGKDKQISIRNQHQLRQYRVLFISPTNETKAYVALESISGSSINSIFEDHISKVVADIIGKDKIEFRLTRIVNLGAFIAGLKNYTPNEIEVQIDKKSEGRSGKAAVEKVSTGLTDKEAKAILNDVIKLAQSGASRTTRTTVVGSLKRFFQRVDLTNSSISKTKIRLVNSVTKTSKTLDLENLEEYIDISFDPQKHNSDYFWEKAVDIL